jgi:hypothetical protein
MSDDVARAWRFYIDDMIAFAEKVLAYVDWRRDRHAVGPKVGRAVGDDDEQAGAAILDAGVELFPQGQEVSGPLMREVPNLTSTPIQLPSRASTMASTSSPLLSR